MLKTENLNVNHDIWRRGRDLNPLLYAKSQNPLFLVLLRGINERSAKYLNRLVSKQVELTNNSQFRGMGFAITPFYGGRRLSFRIKDWGGGQIYSPAVPLDHEISGLLKLFEEALFSNYLNVPHVV